MLTGCYYVQPSLATLLSKPDKSMHDSIFAANGGQTRKLHSYFPDPTVDINNKVRMSLSRVSRCCVDSAACCHTFLQLLVAECIWQKMPCSKAFTCLMLTLLLLVASPGAGCCSLRGRGADMLCACCS